MTRRSNPKPSAQQSALMQSLATLLLLCAFRHGMPVLTAYHQHTDAHGRAIHRETLRSCQGGALGIEEVTSVAVSAPDANEWIKLLGTPAIPQQFAWSIGEGPTLQLMVEQHRQAT